MQYAAKKKPQIKLQYLAEKSHLDFFPKSFSPKSVFTKQKTGKAEKSHVISFGESSDFGGGDEVSPVLSDHSGRSVARKS